jgi:hypothetical protein
VLLVGSPCTMQRLARCKVFKTIIEPCHPTWTYAKILFFSNFSGYCLTACMVIFSEKQNMVLLLWRRSVLANGCILKYEPVVHVLPIIQRLWRYAQLAGWLVNPRRFLLPLFRKNMHINFSKTQTISTLTKLLVKAINFCNIKSIF